MSNCTTAPGTGGLTANLDKQQAAIKQDAARQAEIYKNLRNSQTSLQPVQDMLNGYLTGTNWMNGGMYVGVPDWMNTIDKSGSGGNTSNTSGGQLPSLPNYNYAGALPSLQNTSAGNAPTLPSDLSSGVQKGTYNYGGNITVPENQSKKLQTIANPDFSSMTLPKDLSSQVQFAGNYNPSGQAQLPQNLSGQVQFAGNYNANNTPAAYSVSDATKNTLNDVPGWQDVMKQVQGAYNAVGSNSLAQSAAQQQNALSASNARRGLGNSTFSNTDNVAQMNSLANQQSQLNAQGLLAGLNAAQGIRGESTQNALNLAGLEQAAATGGLDRYQLQEALKNQYLNSNNSSLAQQSGMNNDSYNLANNQYLQNEALKNQYLNTNNSALSQQAGMQNDLYNLGWQGLLNQNNILSNNTALNNATIGQANAMNNETYGLKNQAFQNDTANQLAFLNQNNSALGQQSDMQNSLYNLANQQWLNKEQLGAANRAEQTQQAGLLNDYYNNQYNMDMTRYLTDLGLQQQGRQEQSTNWWNAYNALTGQQSQLAGLYNPGAAANGYGNLANGYGQIAANNTAGITGLIGALAQL
jgi:hypothetical protein